MQAAAIAAALVVLGAAARSANASSATTQGNGWILGEDAETRVNPMKSDPKALADGKAIFKNKCQRCHGATGVGDGPDADPEASTEMDLTNPKRAGRNPDGVVFYKVLNGRRKPKMPPFKDELTEDQIWSVVTYTQTLRKK